MSIPQYACGLTNTCPSNLASAACHVMPSSNLNSVGKQLVRALHLNSSGSYAQAPEYDVVWRNILPVEIVQHLCGQNVESKGTEACNANVKTWWAYLGSARCKRRGHKRKLARGL